MLSSPRRPSNTMRIFSSAEYCLRVARRMSRTTFSAGSLDDRVCCLIFAPVNVTMSQKLSLLQSANSVSRALTADTPIRLAILDGLDARNGRVHNYPAGWNGARVKNFLVIRSNHHTGQISMDPLRWGLIRPRCEAQTGRTKANKCQMRNGGCPADISGGLSKAHF